MAVLRLALANLLEGNITTIVRANPNGQGFGLRTTLPAVYAMDDWRATPDLTINAGLRWEYFSPITESNNKRANFNLNTLTMILATPSNPTASVNPDCTGFSPRFGFALDLHRWVRCSRRCGA